MGSPKEREFYGDRVPVVVEGAASFQGGREDRPQSQGAQVTGHTNLEVCVMQNAATVLDVLHDWRRSLESYVHRKVPAWFGGGEHGKGPVA